MEQPNLLILEMQKGNEKAFSRIYTLYAKALFGIIFNIVRDEDLAEEVLQDVFIKIWDKRDSYSIKKGRFFTWILNIARNAAIDATRSKAFRNSKKNLDATNFVDILETSEKLENFTNSIGIKKFINALKPACIKIIELLYFKGYTQVDTAKELDIPLGTVKSRNRSCINELRMKVIKE